MSGIIIKEIAILGHSFRQDLEDTNAVEPRKIQMMQ